MGIREGGCQCGAVRYQVARDHLVSYVCHCRECQRQSAAAFAISVPVPARDLTISGPMRAYQRPAASGAHTNCWFCETCGTRLYHQSTGSPEIVTLKGGTLDDAGDLRPVAHLWVQRKHVWLTLADDVPQFDTQPDDLRGWRNALLDRSDQT